MPRGRAASPIRPGYVIKAILSGKQPLINPSGGQTGELIEEACPTDMHLTYQALLHEENQLRPRAEHLHGMTTDSFCKLVRFARLMGLIEFVRSEPAYFPPVGGSFYRVEMQENKAGVRKPKAVISDRKIHRLTEKGKIEDKAWGDLRRAWQEHWEVGIASEPGIPTAPIESITVTPPIIEQKRRGRPKKTQVVTTPESPVSGVPEPQKAVEWKPIKLGDIPTMKQFKRLHSHLMKLSKVGAHDPDVLKELTENINMTLGDWDADIETRLTEPQVKSDVDQVKRLNIWWDAIRKVTASINLEDENGNPAPKFQPAIAALAAIIE